MSFFALDPEVAGHLGKHTIRDSSVNPPRVSALHYELDGWLGDDLLTARAQFIVTDALKQALESGEFSGYEFGPVRITKSDLFREIYPQRKLPNFHWLRVTGRARVDDFGVGEDYRLVVSQRVYDVLWEHSIFNAEVERMEE